MIFTAVEQRRVQYAKLTESDTVVAVAHDFSAEREVLAGRDAPRTRIAN
jgi:hypothetical protein